MIYIVVGAVFVVLGILGFGIADYFTNFLCGFFFYFRRR